MLVKVVSIWQSPSSQHYICSSFAEPTHNHIVWKLADKQLPWQKLLICTQLHQLQKAATLEFIKTKDRGLGNHRPVIVAIIVSMPSGTRTDGDRADLQPWCLPTLLIEQPLISWEHCHCFGSSNTIAHRSVCVRSFRELEFKRMDHLSRPIVLKTDCRCHWRLLLNNMWSCIATSSLILWTKAWCPWQSEASGKTSRRPVFDTRIQYDEYIFKFYSADPWVFCNLPAFSVGWAAACVLDMCPRFKAN